MQIVSVLQRRHDNSTGSRVWKLVVFGSGELRLRHFHRVACKEGGCVYKFDRNSAHLLAHCPYQSLGPRLLVEGVKLALRPGVLEISAGCHRHGIWLPAGT